MHANMNPTIVFSSSFQPIQGETGRRFAEINFHASVFILFVCEVVATGTEFHVSTEWCVWQIQRTNVNKNSWALRVI